MLQKSIFEGRTEARISLYLLLIISRIISKCNFLILSDVFLFFCRSKNPIPDIGSFFAHRKIFLWFFCSYLSAKVTGGDCVEVWKGRFLVWLCFTFSFTFSMQERKLQLKRCQTLCCGFRFPSLSGFAFLSHRRFPCWLCFAFSFAFSMQQSKLQLKRCQTLCWCALLSHRRVPSLCGCACFLQRFPCNSTSCNSTGGKVCCSRDRRCLCAGWVPKWSCWTDSRRAGLFLITFFVHWFFLFFWLRCLFAYLLFFWLRFFFVF